jgi:hypothetical protein
MSGGIFLLQGEDNLVEMREQPYDSEDILQALIGRFPSLLAGDQVDSAVPRRWVLLAREASLPDDEDAAGRWSVDHLLIDQDAVPTLVEVKRSSDTRIRREVIGQMLDYAANAVVYWPVERLRGVFEARCEAAGLDPVTELAPVLEVDRDVDGFWEQAGANLRAGRVRLVFVADVIPRELRRVVEFLNGQMNPAEVIAIEVRQYVGPGVKTLVPRVIGQTAEVEARKGTRGYRSARTWNIDTIVAEVEASRGPAEARVVRDLHDWVLERGWRATFGKGAVLGSFIPVLEPAGIKHYPIAVYSSGRIEIQFLWLTRPPFDDDSVKLEFLRRLNEIPGTGFGDDVISRRPRIPLEVFVSNRTAFERLKEALEWAAARAAAVDAAAVASLPPPEEPTPG